MKKSKSKSPKNQAGLRLVVATETHALIREALRQELQRTTLQMVHRLFQDEIAALCGPRYARQRDAEAVRGGSEKGSILWEGKRMPVGRPRANDEDGEVLLESYAALNDYDLFSDEVQQLLIRGISTRDFSEVTRKLDDDLPLSKSSASRAFIHASQKDLDQINSRDLAGEEYCVIMIDGIEQASTHVIVALGFTTKGRKHVLGLRAGASENTEVVKDLLQSLIDRNLTTTPSVLFVLDGAKALRKAVKAHWGDRAIVQRCQLHKIRNVLSYLAKELQGTVERRMGNAYAMKTYDQALSELKKLIRWLRDRSDKAADSLAEGLEETLTVHRLDLPALLRRTFRSTNPIESMFDKVKTRGRRVKNWRADNQLARWSASALLLHQKKFRRIKGYRQLPKLIASLQNLAVDKDKAVA
jgi:transposase-like protein